MNFEYPWDQAPGWAWWATTDKDGTVYWYEKKPELSDDEWWLSELEGVSLVARRTEPHPQAATRWKESLQQRPTANPTADALTALRNLTPATLDALSTHDLEDFSRLCNLWNNYSAEILDKRLYQ